MKIYFILFLLLLAIPASLAVDFDEDISTEDKATFDKILDPVMKIYQFVKYAATVLAVLFLLFAGVTFIMSGNDQGKRESAKMMSTYIVVGLVVIWIAPILVQFLIA